MSKLLTPIIEATQPIIDLIVDYWVLMAISVILVWTLAVWGWTRLIKLIQRWRDYEHGHRFFGPSTWFEVQPKAHLSIKEEILANEAIRETYATASHYERELRDKEKNLKLAWLSPFPRAVKASIRDAHTPKGKKLDARRQVAVVARSIQVAHLPEDRPVANGLRSKDAPKSETEDQKEKRLKRQARINEANHFLVTLATMGKDPAIIEKVENNLLTQLNLKGGILKLDSDDPTVRKYMAHKVAPVDPLTEQITVEYLSDHRAKIVYDLVIGVDQAGKPLHYRVHHTMILGASGAGKGSPIQATIFQLAPFVKEGTAQILAIDPKRAEFALYSRFPSSLIHRISLGSKDEEMRAHADTIAYALNLIDERARNAELSITPGEVEDGRSFTASKMNPLVMLIIDEFPSLFQGFKKLGKDGAVPLAELEQVISMGRSFGVYVMLATQRSEKDILDSVRPNITVPFILRQPSEYMNDLFLGKGALASGYDSTSIPMSTAPDYETAGVGYAVNELGKPVKVRFAYVSKDDMAQLIREFRSIDDGELEEFKREDDKRNRASDVFEEPEDDDGNFGISDYSDPEVPELELLSIDDFEQPLPGMI